MFDKAGIENNLAVIDDLGSALFLLAEHSLEEGMEANSVQRIALLIQHHNHEIKKAIDAVRG